MGRYKNLWNKLRCNLIDESADYDIDDSYEKKSETLKSIALEMCKMEQGMEEQYESVRD